MELQKPIGEFIDQFDETDVSEIMEKTKFHELEEWNSMIGMGGWHLLKRNMTKLLQANSYVIVNGRRCVLPCDI